MINRRVIAIIKRELREKLMSKAFIFTTISIPLIMFIVIGIQAALFGLDEGSSKNIVIISDNNELIDGLKKEFNSRKDLLEDGYKFEFAMKSGNDVENYVREKKKELLNESLTGILVVSSEALNNKSVRYYSKTPKNFKLTRKLSAPINKVLIDAYFQKKSLSMDDLDFARKSVDFTGLKVSKEEPIKEEGYGNLILAYVFTFLLYISLIMIGSMTMQTVIEEKNNRIVEVVLSSVSPKELMTGKILGAAITGVAQMAIWLSPILILVSTSWFTLPPEVIISISASQLLYFLFNFFLGLLTFVGLFAMMGSIFDNPQDAQSGVFPIIMLVMIPFFIAMSMMENPNNAVAGIASMFPFASLIVMPAKMTIADVPVWQIGVAVVVNLLTIAAIFPVAGKIYRVGILRTGKKPKWSEVIKWLKQ
ncbi:MAG: ABC transporter permease [Ignavibacteria bacterium]|nr:MAG: ABC transporter permease [Ignavibacteria bacterium]